MSLFSFLHPASLQFWLLVGCVGAFGFWRYALDRRRNSPPLPPGPKPSYFSSASLPSSYQWRTYAKWREIYGDVIYIHVFGNPIIILNSLQAVEDLFDKRSNIYSSRPVRTMVTDLMGWDWLFSTMPYGLKWRRHRAMFQQHFHQNNQKSFQPLQTKETHIMLRNLLHKPDSFSYEIRRTAAAVVMSLSYGHPVSPEGSDPFVKLADDALEGLGQAGVFGTYLVDYLPLLKYVPAWMPGAGFKRQANEWRKLTRAMIEEPFQVLKQKLATGTAASCLASQELERLFGKSREGAEEEEELIKDVSAIAYAAGADTTVSAISSFFLAMTVSPSIQTKAQASLDRLLGSQPTRLPTYDDRPALPYVDCLVWECLRWNPVTPMGLPRQVTEDDVYGGYRIPKGTTVMPNVWAILHDERRYPQPMRFWPDRFEGAVAASTGKNASRAGVNDLPWAAFGFGRRMCPGRWLAFDQIWIAVATILTVFDISKPVDDQGVPIEPDLEYTSSGLSRPKPFKCRITPRSEAALALIQQLDNES